MQLEIKYKFQIPDEKKRETAFGPLDSLTEQDQFYYQEIKKLCKIINYPKKGDWLMEHPSEGQTFKIFVSRVKMGEGSAITEKKKTIYLQPLELTIDVQFLKQLVKYCEAFFYPLKVECLKSQDLLSMKNIRSRESQGFQQYCAPDIFNNIDKLLPKDGFCILGITNYDLYIDEENNYVFGLADPRARKGVFSFCRYMPQQGENEKMKIQDSKSDNIVLFRSCKVICHEITHLFGVRHCEYYQCAMNGSNSLEEDDSKPIELCQICLRKLQHAVSFNIIERYQKLLEITAQFQGNFQEVNKYIKQILTRCDKK